VPCARQIANLWANEVQVEAGEEEVNALGHDDVDSLLDDGFGNVWHKCEPYDQCAMEIVRPGKVQCERCQFKNERPLSNVDEYLLKN